MELVLFDALEGAMVQHPIVLAVTFGTLAFLAIKNTTSVAEDSSRPPSNEE
jgi:hypothetical protein